MHSSIFYVSWTIDTSRALLIVILRAGNIEELEIESRSMHSPTGSVKNKPLPVSVVLKHDTSVSFLRATIRNENTYLPQSWSTLTLLYAFEAR